MKYNMTQEKKDLLLKDLCARLPYGVKVYGNYSYSDGDKIIDDIKTKVLDIDDIDWVINNIEIKPYLFPLSSMTEEQKSYLYFNTKFEVDVFGTLVVKMDSDDNYLYTDISDYTSIINWLIENKFDIYGLIPMGLAIDATGKNIY